uniref:mRNA cap-binding protein n=1 Tax=Rhizophora mucronata TaxID=61149 RepID=A0A2P2K5S3_RHIMU
MGEGVFLYPFFLGFFPVVVRAMLLAGRKSKLVLHSRSVGFLLIFITCYMQVLALVGDQLEYGENICGAVLSIRYNEDILSVWNRNASDHQAVMALRDSIKRHLKLPLSYVMEYKPHDASLRDNSSYRNTWLRG